MMKHLAALSFALALLAPLSLHAQTSNGKVTTVAPSYTNGATSPMSLDTAGNLRMNCVSGCAGGSFNNNGSAVAPSSSNGQAAAWLYAFDATNWQYIGVDGSHNLTVKVNVALPTGANTIGNVGVVAGTAVIGKVSIDQTTPGTTNGVQVNAALPAGSNIIGNVRIDQTTPGTTNGVQDAATSATGAAVPAKAILAGAQSGANIVAQIQASASVPISIATNTITQIVALSGSTKIYVTSFDFLSAGTANFKFVYGTGTDCGTGTTDLTGLYNLTAQSGVAKGSGQGPILVVPAGKALCVSDNAAVQISGSVSYTQF